MSRVVIVANAWLVAALAVAGTGCFDPQIPAGVACGASGSCPGDLRCDPVDNVCRAEPSETAEDAGVDGAMQLDAAAQPDAAPLPIASLAMDPSSADFGSVVEGSVSTLATFTVTNSGTGPSTTLSVTLIGSNQFSLPVNTCSGVVVAAGDSCTVDVRFEPTEAGTPSATLRVADQDGHELDAALLGTGLALGDLQMSLTSHDFGTQNLGASAVTQLFTVTNTGGSASGTLTTVLDDLTNFAVASNDCSGTLPAAGTCNISVVFAPTAVGSHVTSLTVRADPGGTAAASVGGRGVATLSVTRAGTGGGTITSAPGGIDCGGTCSADFSVSTVVLDQEPQGTSVFAGWSGGSCSGTGSCTVAMTAARAVTANWDFCRSEDFLRCDSGGVAVYCNGAGSGERNETCTYDCNAAAGRCNECVPNSVSCSAGVQSSCGTDGLVGDTQVCALGCFDSTRCADLEPSNGLGSYLDLTRSAPAITLTDGATIDTGTGEVNNGNGSAVTVPSELLDAPTGGVAVRVLMVNSFTTTGSVTVTGTPALAVVSDGDIEIGGVLELSSVGSYGGDPSCRGGVAQYSDDYGGSGGGGGGFGTLGAKGGSLWPDNQGLPGGTGGSESGEVLLTPLRGGCGGAGCSFGFDCQSSNAGRGGGAVQLVSRTRVRMAVGGGVNAGGGAGGTYYPNYYMRPVAAGSGGGSGGAILIEAPVVRFEAGGGAAANGGGGGCQEGAGLPGGLSSNAAVGASCNASGPDYDGSGGNGATGDSAATEGGSVYRAAAPPDANSYGRSGGGGGGGAGRIRINTYSNQFDVAGGAILSPAASVGSIGRR